MRGKEFQMENKSHLNLKSQAKRLLVTSDISFLDRGEQDIADIYNPSIIPSTNSLELENTPITPPNQKIPGDTSPCRLKTPKISGFQIPKPTEKLKSSNNLLSNNTGSIASPANLNALHMKLRPKKKSTAKR